MEIISILLPIVLFIITLIVIFTIRSADRRERRLDVMRKYVNQYMGEIKEAEERFHEVLGVIETRLQNDKGEISQLFEQIHGERAASSSPRRFGRATKHLHLLPRSAARVSHPHH